MRTWMAGTMVLPAAALLLVACGDRETGPVAPVLPQVRSGAVSSASGSCGGMLQSRERAFGTLPWVSVTATFGGSFALPFNLMQQMNFPIPNPSMVPCLDTDDVAYGVRENAEEDTLLVEIPVPTGVDPSAWSKLTNRERAKLIKVAELIFSVAPSYYGSPDGVIQQKLLPALLEAKTRAKLRALDFLNGTRAELLAGGIYGCMLFQNLALDNRWVLLRPETLQLTADLSAAFAESLFDMQPLSGIVFARNGAYGADIASRAGTLPIDCGWSVFGASGSGRISIADPYAPPPIGQQPRRPNIPDGGGPWDQ